MSSSRAAELRGQIQECEDRLRAAAERLARGLLPSLDAAAVEQAYVWTGLEFLESGKPLQHLEEERQRLRREQEALTQRPDYEVDGGTAQQLHLEEQERLQRHKASLLPLLNACHGHPRFRQLLRSGFGTPRYRTPFWRLSYYWDRAAAAELCQRTGKKNWAALLGDYELAAESFQILSDRLSELGQARPRTAREEWLGLEKRLNGLSALHLQTLQVRMQLALLKGGAVWERLARAALPAEVRPAYEETTLLVDLLEQLRSQR